MSISSNNFQTGMEFDKNFKKPSIKIPGLDDSDTSSDDSGAENSFLSAKKNTWGSITNEFDNSRMVEDEEYTPTCSKAMKNIATYRPAPTSPTYDPLNKDDEKYEAKSPVTSKKMSPPPPHISINGNVCQQNEKKKQKSLPKRRNSIAIISNSSSSSHILKTERKKMKLDNKETTTTTTSNPNLSIINIKDDTIFITRYQKKNSYDINLQISLKYFKNIMPIFNKGVKVDLFAHREKSDNIWCNVILKNTENMKFPLAIFKIINIDENIISNLNVGMNNSIKFKESVLNTKSDKNYKIYDESGVIQIGDNKDLYIISRIELKKNMTYVFNTSLNAIFARQYINIQNEFYKCSLYSRDDNKYLLCLVINVFDNYIIENGVRLMQNINNKN